MGQRHIQARFFVYGDQCYRVLINSSRCSLINVSAGKGLIIRALDEMSVEAVGYNGRFNQNTFNPDSTMCKVLNVSKVSELVWVAGISLKEGINLTYKAFKDNLAGQGVLVENQPEANGVQG